MWELIRYEFKKLAKSKVNMVAMVLGIALFTLALFTTFQSNIQGEDGEWLYGKADVTAFSEASKQFEGAVTNESISQNVLEYQKWYEDYNITQDDDMIDADHPGFEFIRTHRPYTIFLFPFLGVDGEGLRQIDVNANPDYYQMYRDAYKRDYLDTPDEMLPRNISEKEKEYWIEKSNQITDLKFGNVYVWNDIGESIWSFMLISIILVILVSMTYTREYKCKTDAILLTTKYGKTKLIHAKGIASFLYVMSYFFVCVILFYAIEFARYGREGFDTSIQISRPSCVYHLTVFQVSLLQFLTVFAFAFAIYAIMLFASARIKSALPVCGIGIALQYIASCVVLEPSDNSVVNHLVSLLPSELILGGYVRPISYQIFGMVFNVYQVGITLYILIGVLFFVFAGKGFKVRHE